jgi:hypothetical protein
LRTLGLASLLIVLAAVASGADEPPVIGWEEAARHVGEEVVVEGRVMGVHCSPLSCLLAFEPTFNGFTAVVQAAAFDTFPPAELDKRFTGRRVRVRGPVQDRDKKPEIQVTTRDQLRLVDASSPAEQQAAQNAQAQTDALERIADVLERLQDLTERLVAVQERMETVLASLEEREAAAAAAQAAAATPPAYTGPARGAYETIRTVKRGMTTTDVERLVGQPQWIETTGNGWTTWYYDGGRSISFDGRGRARSLIGFATP